MAKKIIFFKIASFSHINDKVEAILRSNFPENELIVVDFWETLKREKKILVFNLLSIFAEYGKDIIAGKKKLKECIFITNYFFKKSKEIAAGYISAEDVLFTIQTQSLFDASYDSVPHFLYTDHTILENRNYPEFHNGKMPSSRWITHEKSIYHNALINFTMSSNITRSLIRDYQINPGNLKCVWAGSNLKLQAKMLEKRNYSGKKILFVGRRWERKGGPVLLRAFEKVLKVHPHAELIIVGSNPVVNIKNVKVTGNISLHEVANFYAESSVFCLPTRIEPFGIVFLEAMMYSLPVIATNVGAIPDFIGRENGILVEPNNEEQLAEAIITLLDSPELCRSLGEEGFKVFQEKYTWEKVGLRMASAIKTALHSNYSTAAGRSVVQ